MKPGFLFLAALVLVAVLFAASGDQDRGAPGEIAIEANIDAVLDGVTVVASREGEMLWRLVTDRAVMPSGGTVANLGKVALTVPREGLFVKSGSGVYDLASNDLKFTNAVVADTGRMVLYSEYARLDSATGEVVSDADVLVEGVGFTVKGRGFWAKGNEVKILGSVEAEVE